MIHKLNIIDISFVNNTTSLLVQIVQNDGRFTLFWFLKLFFKLSSSMNILLDPKTYSREVCLNIKFIISKQIFLNTVQLIVV
jgi:hypothetical protein